jgi:hypothetical protein
MALSPIALAATFTGIGVVVLGSIIGLVILIVRDRRRHLRMLADLEERGVVITQSRQGAGRANVSRPRAVLRRNTILPFDKSGWGTLPSVETLNLTEPRSIPPHYAPSKPVSVASKSKRLSWPFTARRASGKAIHMRKIRTPVLSTVIESPKPSPLVPVLGGSIGGESASPRKSLSRPSSDQSLLQRHPAFRDIDPTAAFGIPREHAQSDPLHRSLTAKAIAKTEPHVGPHRSKSVVEALPNRRPGDVSRPQPRSHVRSTSHSSGIAPDGELPPLPLEVARVKGQPRKNTLLNCSPSRLSISSYESAGSSILVTQTSPVMRSPNTRVQKVTKRQWRNSMIVGPRPIRDTLTLHGKNQRSQDSVKSSAATYSMALSSAQGGDGSSLLTKSSSLQSVGKAGNAEPVIFQRVASPTGSPLTVRSFATPKRRSGSHVTPFGSPEARRKRSSILQNASGNLKRELSQASTQASSSRSSNGNPFQWDPSPMSMGKPSNLKGSPSARNKGHKRQSVSILLPPTVHWPRSRSPSPGTMKGIVEESPNTPSAKNQDIGLGFSDKRSLPRPPSISTFTPDLKITTTSIHASLTPNSPTLPMANYDHGPIGSPVVTQNYYVPTGSPREDEKRMNAVSMFSIPKFPSPCHETLSPQKLGSPPMFAISLPSDEQENDNTRAGASSPFEVHIGDHTSMDGSLTKDEYDPEQPHLVFQTPSVKPTRNFSSPFSTIPEESSARSDRTMTRDQYRSDDSPPCSPKTLPQQFQTDQASILEHSLDTIDPSLLSASAFHSLTTPFDTSRGSIIEAPYSATRTSIPIPSSPRVAQTMFTPLLEGAFSSSSPSPIAREFPLAGSKSSATAHAPSDSQTSINIDHHSAHSSPYSLYSLPSPTSPSLMNPPCSPRPAHAQLPTPSLNFAGMPKLTPSPCGPRSSSPRPLRTSIQQLRRMNSDAEKGGRSREERRYLRLGRRDSIALPGDESWLDELSDTQGGAEIGLGLGIHHEDDGEEGEGDETWDEAKGQNLIGDLLHDWEDDGDATVLDLDLGLHGGAPTPTVAPPPRTSSAVHAATTTAQSSSRPGTPRPASGNGKGHRSSSIWEDGEKFWCSTPPREPVAVTSPNKPRQRFVPLSSSPAPISTTSTAPSPKIGNTKKRDFEVAKDGEGNAARDRNSAGEKRKNRKRSALGVSTTNPRINIHPPSSPGGMGTPGSLYDAEGFLRS